MLALRGRAYTYDVQSRVRVEVKVEFKTKAKVEVTTKFAYLLLGLVTRTGPFRDNVFLSLGVGCKSKSNTGKGSSLRFIISDCAARVLWACSQNQYRRSAGPLSGPRPQLLPC
jgi:hypothetical protein